MRLKSQDVAALPSPAVQVRLPVAVLPPPTSQVLKRLMEEDCGTGTVTVFFFYKNLNNSLSKINNKQKHNKKQNNKNNK